MKDEAKAAGAGGLRLYADNGDHTGLTDAPALPLLIEERNCREIPHFGLSSP